MSVESMLKGVVDLHVHASPCLFARKASDLKIAEDYAARGGSALVLKAHHGDTVGRALAVTEALKGTFRVFGGVVLNHYVGGFNLYAVEGSLKTGAKIIWMPTIHALNHLRFYGFPGYNSFDSEEKEEKISPSSVAGLTIFDPDKKIKKEVLEILSMIAKAEACLATGHLSKDETFALCRVARELKVERVLVNHPDFETLALSPAEQRELTGMGCFLEKTYLPLTPSWGGMHIKDLARNLQLVGPEHCVLSTDLGQTDNPMPGDGFQKFLEGLSAENFSLRDLSLMSQENPSHLLNIPTLTK